MKEYLSAAEVAELWGTSRQYVQKLARNGTLEGVSPKLSQGKKLEIPIKALFYGTHKNFVLWGEPYETENGWEIKKYTAGGEEIYSVTKK